MRHTLPSIYRLSPHGSPRDPLQVTARLGAIWYCGFQHTLAPAPAAANAPWCQFVLVPLGTVDGVEDRLIVADAELSAHGLAWVLQAPENRCNVFVRLARGLDIEGRLATAFGDQATVALGACVVDPLSARPQLRIRTLAVDGRPVQGADAARALAGLF